ncbi:MAG: methionine--tRNA ligase [Gemmatimonadetes bacterium]|nr:methionine--tRNA ligase [Gemmatimonadota bacterium]
MSNFYVTTPIYYVNDAPHIGHAYTTLLADVLARYHRLMDEATFFLTGTDEHGQKVHDAALKAGISPQQHADRTVLRFIELWKRLEVSNDGFIRTTEETHRRVVSEILRDLWERGEIYKGEYSGWYSVREERFYTEKDLVDGMSPEGTPVERVVEENYFFRMSRYQQWLIDYIDEHPEFIQPEFRRNETLGALKQPIRDLCISRPKSRMSWGIELPFDNNYVCYVWFDALVNYISGIGFRGDGEDFDRWWPASYHLIGKDILTTHTIYWPTMLQAIGLPQPRTIFAHGWWLTGEAKMSKSVGNVVDPMAMADRYGVDALRYHLLADMTLGNDASFTEEKFIRRYNADLANDLGNLASRVAKMVERSFDGVLPAPADTGADEQALEKHATAAATEMIDHVLSMSLDRGIARVLETVRETNRYFDRAAPWTLAKKGDLERLGTVLYTAAESLRVVSGLLFPVIPQKMGELRRTLGLPEEKIEPHFSELSKWGGLTPGSRLAPLSGLFPRIKKAKPAREPAAPSTETAPTEVELCEIGDVEKLGLTTAVVLDARPVEDADRLLRLEIDLGTEKRQIVAGIAKQYSPDQLVGRTIVVVANLQPAEIRGVRSNGMLLAAKKGKKLRLLTVDGETPGGWRIS